MLEKNKLDNPLKASGVEEQEHELYERSTQVPVVHSVSFGYRDIDTWQKVALGEAEGSYLFKKYQPNSSSI